MVRRRRTKLWPLLSVLLLLSLWSMPLSAREPPYGPEDYHISNSPGAGFGDDDDDDFHITAGPGVLVLGIWYAFVRLYFRS
jgi:hypothetical protein